MANSYSITNKNKKPKNAQRQQKIDKTVKRLETSLLSQLHKYERGEEVSLVSDSLGNKYISVEIGCNKIISSKVPDNYNNKTNAIYTALYERMKQLGFVVCQRGMYDDGRRWVEAWLLVEHNENPPEEETKDTITKQAGKVYSELLDIVPQYDSGSLDKEVDQFVKEQAMNFMKKMMDKKNKKT